MSKVEESVAFEICPKMQRRVAGYLQDTLERAHRIEIRWDQAELLALGVLLVAHDTEAESVNKLLGKRQLLS